MPSGVGGDLTPLCPICEHRVEIIGDRDVMDTIILRVGCQKISPKHGKGYFQPDEFDDGEEEKAFHFHCLQTVGFDFADGNDYDDPMRCVFCSDSLRDEGIYYEMELGGFTLDDDARIIWVPVRDGKNRVCRIYACWDCVFVTMSEGHDNTGRRRLGMDEVEETTEIDYSDIPSWPSDKPRSFKSRRPPPRRRATG